MNSSVMSSSTNATDFFPKIGSVVEGGDPQDGIERAEDERLVQEIESLCMVCHEQVHLPP
jgi:hypothetical protein